MITMTLWQYAELASLSVILGAWLRLTLQAAQSGSYKARHLLIVMSLCGMCIGTGMLMVETFAGLHNPSWGDMVLHSSLAVCNALVLLRATPLTGETLLDPPVGVRQDKKE